MCYSYFFLFATCKNNRKIDKTAILTDYFLSFNRSGSVSICYFMFFIDFYIRLMADI